jgi:hypothetical protein
MENRKGNSMKKIIFLTLILTLFLAACGGSADPATPSESGKNSEQIDIGTRELPLSSTLAIGTLQLEKTDYAVAPDQATELLPLWQVLNSLTSSDAAAQEEIVAITEQIQETMTAEQLATIEAMEITGEDTFATMQELGLTNAQFNAEGAPQVGGFGGRQGASVGGFPGGEPPGSPGGQEISPEQMATAQARRAENGGGAFGSRMLAPLAQAVIELLESKAQ